MRNILTRAAALVAAVVFTMLLCACSVTYDESEIISASAELIEASYDINTVFFGSGLPAVESDDEVLRHYEIAEDSPYHTKDEIKTATLAVYSPDYAEFLFEKAFAGFVFSAGDEDSVEADQIIDARYVEYGDRLVILPIKDEDVMKLDRTYDTANITVVSQKRGRVVLSVPSFVDGVPSDDVELTVIMTADGWRLDTPTY
ncbi:MAG: hypothetical protein IJO81_03510 [Clostridia bacterium]|nr:hypothetical protein [Clostridia bacterium]